MLMTNEVQEASNVEKARAVIEGFAERDPVLATKYMDPTQFRHHYPEARDGVEGIKEFIGHLPPTNNPLKVIRAFQDGPYVFTHSAGDIFGPKVTFDIFRFQNGSIVELWGNVTEMTPPNESGHSPVDGPTEPGDLERTTENKALVRRFYEQLFLNGQFDASYFDGDKFIRHDARGGDGVAALVALMAAQKKTGVVMKVGKIEQVLGEGNFVLVMASGSIADKPVAYYDLFRVEGGKIEEHWDVIQNIPDEEHRRNRSGKF